MIDLAAIDHERENDSRRPRPAAKTLIVPRVYVLGMTRTLRIVGLGVAAIVALWIVLEVLALLFGLVAWVVSAVVSLAVLALVVYIGYLVVTSLLS